MNVDSQPVGLIAGGGRLPLIIVQSLKSQNKKPVIVGIAGFVEPELLLGCKSIISPLGAAGSMMKFLKENDVRDLVIAGRVSRPDWLKIKPDARGIMIIARLLMKKTQGDDALLKVLRGELERDGFTLRAVQDFAPDLLAPEGVLTSTQPEPSEWPSINFGFQISQDHGRKDLGQSIVVQDETILGLEDNSGTDALIERCAAIKSAGLAPILVKTCKPQQDRALDLPTVGPDTVRKLVKAGFRGIVVQAYETLLVDKEEIIKLCDDNSIFLLGYSLEHKT